MTEAITPHALWVLTAFLIGYAAIIIEQYVHFNKAATALLMGIVCWTILFLEHNESVEQHLQTLTTQMFKVSQVLFFLMGALTIVEIISSHKGFKIITDLLFVNSKRRLLWLIGLITFFMSSVLDNLTTTVVMVSLVRKLLSDREEKLILGGLIVIAANAGGAWTPIGDVATTLLWINGQITTLPIMRDLFLPSLACLLIPLLWCSLSFKGEIVNRQEVKETVEPFGTLILFLGVGSLIFVPIFKVLTNLPAFMGMMLGLAFLWIVTDLMHSQYDHRRHLRVTELLPKVDMSVILFYLGILLSINALDSAGLLKETASWLSKHIPNSHTIAILIGLISSILDNVSLVAACIGMYGLNTFPTDSTFWQLVAYCAGTGGSILIIGSAAGVAFMALEKVDFMWYLRVIGPKALAGYFGGVLVYLLL